MVTVVRAVSKQFGDCRSDEVAFFIMTVRSRIKLQYGKRHGPLHNGRFADASVLPFFLPLEVFNEGYTDRKKELTQKSH